MITRRRFLHLLTVSAAGWLAGCGAAGTEPDYTVVIRRDSQFYPATLIVPRGALVAWHNLADESYRLFTNEGPTAAWESGDLYPSDRWLYRFESVGTYVYGCRYHPDMLGVITVEAA